MNYISGLRWGFVALVLALAVGGAWIAFGPLYAKGRHGGGHGNGHRQDRATAAAPAALSGGEVEQANALFAKTCAGCHGEKLEGGVGPSLVGVGSRYSLGKIERIAQYGKGQKKPVPMPSGLASGEEAKLLARWLATNPTPTGGSTTQSKSD